MLDCELMKTVFQCAALALVLSSMIAVELIFGTVWLVCYCLHFSAVS